MLGIVVDVGFVFFGGVHEVVDELLGVVVVDLFEVFSLEHVEYFIVVLDFPHNFLQLGDLLFVRGQFVV